MLYKLILYIHVASVILSIGPFFVLIPMVKKLRVVDKDLLQAYLMPFFFSVQLTKHAGHVLFTTGLLLIVFGPWSLRAPWIIMTIVLLGSSIFFVANAFSPKLKKLTQSDDDRDKILKDLSRSIWIYIGILMIVLWLMVNKPVLW
ncbi:DUF2269 family protein [Bacillus solimangrovi]|uniref:DUF2269 domain-containing protein n=1 Tax=Bacillus solimangrovi TaxID=1305675 RepID=A0A1E5LJN7_9BACI|nr:DUF2269 family protein [Bacillus solimangrovi]OEH94300.1 hypothetical protein BFG57_08570 [Bacillus solimangrovi]